VSELRQAIQRDPDSRRVMDMARALEGSVRHASTHAAGVVICQEPLTDHVALQRNTNGDEDAPPTTQYAMKPVADVGLLKMDFLGLKNLTVLDRAFKLIAQTVASTCRSATYRWMTPERSRCCLERRHIWRVPA
jgi:DNA polymerase III subunit alpha